MAERGKIALWLHGHRHTPYHFVSTSVAPFPLICVGSARKRGAGRMAITPSMHISFMPCGEAIRLSPVVSRTPKNSIWNCHAFEILLPIDYTLFLCPGLLTSRLWNRNMQRLTFSLIFLALAPPAFADEATKTEVKTYQVPFRLTNTNHVLVRVKINGKGPYNFILDTGSPALFVSTKVCAKLGVKADRLGWGIFDRFEVEGGVVIPKARGRVEDPFQLEGMNGLGLAGAELHGMIGYTILARYRLEFDFSKQNHKMGWTPLNFRPPQPLGPQGGAGGGMEMIGGFMKVFGALLARSRSHRSFSRISRYRFER